MLRAAVLLLAGLFLATAAGAAVEFPGPQPGTAKIGEQGGLLTLENSVISVSWKQEGGTLRPARLMNKLTGKAFDQAGAELFRLATKPCGALAPQTGVYVAVRLSPDKVTAQISADGAAWTTLASFPRSEFPGEPKFFRVGKMNTKAEAKDYAGEAGEDGEGVISEILPQPASLPGARFAFKAAANKAAATECAFPVGSNSVACRIDKGTDKGMSWAPALALVWEDGNRFLLVGVRDGRNAFNVTTAAGESIISAAPPSAAAYNLAASSFRLAGAPRIAKAPLPKGSPRIADRIPGAAIEADLVSSEGVRVHWHAELRDGSNYVRQTVTFSAPEKNVPLLGVELADIRVPGLETVGKCPGSPAAGNGMFFGVEMPGCKNTVTADGARTGFDCKLELSPKQAYTFGAVAGVAPEGQLRRAFLCYVERERARASAPFLHYNCWYDFAESVNEKDFLALIAAFDRELTQKRGVAVASYLIDDGWDNFNEALWQTDKKKFPQGFANVKKALDKAGSHLSIWISPLGGYGGAAERTVHARKMGLIPQDASLDLSLPGYKAWFQARCLQLMRESGVNSFKWDKAGDGVSPHFMALLDIARELRKENPALFVNVTVGTWPSPFWLNHIDSTWRNGSADVGWAGKGDDREQWLTFRDGNCHSLFVEAAPLYPLNSVMHHGIVLGRHYQGQRVAKAGADLKHEARSYFGNGAMLQELYLTPALMTPAAWDRVAESAKWAKANADVLADSHWVGGDPLKLEPYGYAAWATRKGTLTLRNPDDQPREITLDAATVFELPAAAAKKYALASPYKDQRVQNLTLEAGKPVTVRLEPFEVLVFDALPVR
jgi:hypothetical protein